jgi:hypothetical protein
MGVEIRAEGAREAAKKAIREADPRTPKPGQSGRDARDHAVSLGASGRGTVNLPVHARRVFLVGYVPVATSLRIT